jgi:ribonuclease P protein component
MLHIIAPKKVFKRAVDRNKAKRRVRAALNQLKPDWRAALAGKLYTTREMLDLPFPELQAKIKHALSL